MEITYIEPHKRYADKPIACRCYICGREYGTRSLQIHIKACRKKWDIEQKRLPVKKRKPCPEPPVEFDQVSNNYSILLMAC